MGKYLCGHRHYGNGRAVWNEDCPNCKHNEKEALKVFAEGRLKLAEQEMPDMPIFEEGTARQKVWALDILKKHKEVLRFKIKGEEEDFNFWMKSIQSATWVIEMRFNSLEMYREFEMWKQKRDQNEYDEYRKAKMLEVN